MESEKTMQECDSDRATIEEVASWGIPELVEKLRQCDAKPVMNDMDIRHREFLFWQLVGLRRSHREGFEQGRIIARMRIDIKSKIRAKIEERIREDNEGITEAELKCRIDAEIEGRINAKIEDAYKMMMKRLPLADITYVTGLSKVEIEQISRWEIYDEEIFY
ncbi:MAG: hypothetical protein LBL39_02890 [Planctomycetaceae bacterium]|jgi:hypothetical protein|nr:hypothetical protein [Planctomycetaceae bacterium]